MTLRLTHRATRLFAHAPNSSLLLSATDKNHVLAISTTAPEVLVTGESPGRANVGKSLLLNALLGRSTDNALIRSSKKAGKTRSLDFFGVGSSQPQVVLVDSPGYGARGRPEWGELWNWYIQERSQLRRIYILINGKHGVTHADKTVLEMLHETVVQRTSQSSRLTLQAIITKCDLLPPALANPEYRQALLQDILAVAPTCLPPIFTSVRVLPRIGIETLRESVAEATS